MDGILLRFLITFFISLEASEWKIPFWKLLEKGTPSNAKNHENLLNFSTRLAFIAQCCLILCNIGIFLCIFLFTFYGKQQQLASTSPFYCHSLASPRWWNESTRLMCVFCFIYYFIFSSDCKFLLQKNLWKFNRTEREFSVSGMVKGFTLYIYFIATVISFWYEYMCVLFMYVYIKHFRMHGALWQRRDTIVLFLLTSSVSLIAHDCCFNKHPFLFSLYFESMDGIFKSFTSSLLYVDLWNICEMRVENGEEWRECEEVQKGYRFCW